MIFMHEGKYLLGFALLILVLLASPSGVESSGQTADNSLLEEFSRAESGVIESGELLYINQGKKLGNESYQIMKTETGGLRLEAEGVVTPPIPIPFVKPKIKFSQNIEVDRYLKPESLFLQYKGPLGIGSKKINATIAAGEIELKRGKDRKKLKLPEGENVFVGTTSSQALFALILATREEIELFTEIRSGGSGPPGQNEERVLVEVRLESTSETELNPSGAPGPVKRYVFVEPENGRRKEIFVRDGTFLVYRASSEEGSFYVFRSDLLGKDFRFKGQDEVS